MRIIKSLIFALSVSVPVVSFAFSADDSAVKKAMKDHQAAVVVYAEKNGKPVPAVVEYTYGMKLDIAKVIRTSPELRECTVIPQLMTYEDSKGELITVQSRIMSRCLGKN